MIRIEAFHDAAALLAWLVSTNAQAAALIVAVLVLRALLGRRLTPGWRGALWLLIALRLLVPMAVESRYSLAAVGRSIASMRAATAPIAPAGVAADGAPRVSVTYGPIAADTRAAATPAATRSAPEATAIAMWLAGVALLIGRDLAAAASLRRAVRRMRPIDDAVTLALLSRCAADVGVRRRVRLVETDRLRAPAVCGILRPVILLPVGAAQTFAPAELRLVLMHELVHVRRNDALVAALYRVVVALHWFNPLVWLAAAAFRADRELACDAAVLARLDDPVERRAYGDCVIRVVAHVAGLRPHAASLGLFGTARSLRKRVEMIADRSDRASRSRRAARLAIGAPAVLFVALAALAGEPAATLPAMQRDAASLLSRRIEASQRYDAMPVGDAVAEAAKHAGVTVRFDWDALARVGVTRETTVTASVRNVSLGKTLEVLLGDAKRPTDFESEGDTIVVSSADEIARRFGVSRRYGLGNLLPGNDAAARATISQQILELVADTVDPQTWKHKGGTAGTIEVDGDHLVVRHTPRRHAEIARLIDQLTDHSAEPTSTPAATAPFVDRAKVALDAAVGVAVRFDAQTFEHVVGQLRDRSPVPIFVNWTAIEGAGVSKTAPVTLRLPPEVALSKVLSIVLDAAGGGVVRLGYELSDGVITISTRDDLRRELATRTYDIRDLLVRVPDFDAGASTQPAADAPPAREQLVEQIIKLIQDTLESDTWRANGGTIGAIKELGGQLIVTTEPKTQEQIVQLLTQLREGRAVQISVEARFMTVDVTQLPPAFNQMLIDAKPAAGDAPTAMFLDDAKLKAWRATLDEAARTLAAPRLTLFNGQSAYVAVTTSETYVSAYSLTKTPAGESRYEQVTKRVEPGVTAAIQATTSADRKYVTLTVKPTVTQLLRFESEPFPAGAAGKDALSIQRPVLDVQSLQTTVSVPDRGTVLLTAGGVDKGRVLLILMRPTLIIQRKIEQEAFPLLTPDE